MGSSIYLSSCIINTQEAKKSTVDYDKLATSAFEYKPSTTSTPTPAAAPAQSTFVPSNSFRQTAPMYMAPPQQPIFRPGMCGNGST